MCKSHLGNTLGIYWLLPWYFLVGICNPFYLCMSVLLLLLPVCLQGYNSLVALLLPGHLHLDTVRSCPHLYSSGESVWSKWQKVDLPLSGLRMGWDLDATVLLCLYSIDFLLWRIFLQSLTLLFCSCLVHELANFHWFLQEMLILWFSAFCSHPSVLPIPVVVITGGARHDYYLIRASFDQSHPHYNSIKA